MKMKNENAKVKPDWCLSGWLAVALSVVARSRACSLLVVGRSLLVDGVLSWSWMVSSWLVGGG